MQVFRTCHELCKMRLIKYPDKENSEKYSKFKIVFSTLDAQ